MIIDLQEIPNYSFYFMHENDKYEVELNARNGMTYLSYKVNDVDKAFNVVCLNGVEIHSLFVFKSHLDENPYYTNFSDYKLEVLL